MKRSLWMMLAVLLLVGVACGGGDDPTVPTSPTTAAQPTETTPTETEEACEDQTGDDQIELEMQDNFFEPDCLVVLASQPIHIENNGAALHGFTISGTQVDIDVQPGEEFDGEGNAVEPGEYEFVCKYHPGMNGTLTAQ